MTDSSTPAPGYYPAPHANGAMQYWDGAVWHAVAPTTQNAAKQKQPKLVSVRHRTAAWMLAGVGALGLVLGLAMGGAGSASNVSALEARVVSLQTAVDDAESVATEAESDVADYERAIGERDTAVTRVGDLEAQLAALQTEADARQQRISDLESEAAARASAPAAPGPQPAPAQPAAPANVYYENCDAARAAGGAPVHAGQPGYGRHLDRDGDGTGCE